MSASSFFPSAPRPIDVSMVKGILNRGTFYYPASAHYGGATVVSCDLCRRGNLTACIGFDKYDLCLICVERTTSTPHGLASLTAPIAHPVTLMMQDSVREPVVTKMMQDSVRRSEPQTYMMQDSVRRSEPQTYMMQDSVRRRVTEAPVAAMMHNSVRRQITEAPVVPMDDIGLFAGFPEGF